MKNVIFFREDFNNPLHPFMFDQLLEELGLDPKSNVINIVVKKATSDVEN